MSPDKDKALCEKYPKIFAQRHGNMRETAMCWGFECSDGWYPLIDTLCNWLQSMTDNNPNHAEFPQVVATQVKEKFGGLRFYVHGATDYQHGAIDMAESLSYRICEVCGLPGKPTTEGWIKTVCDKHIKTS